MPLDERIQALKATGAQILTPDVDDLSGYLTDWRKRLTGRALAVARPANTEEVAAVVKVCAQHQIPIVPQGGNTGLVQGSVPDASGRALVLSLQRMTAVRAIDPANGTLTVEAGLPLAQVQAAADQAGLLFPLSLASEGSCTIGGNLSANAGGTQVLRYGNTRDLTLGLEVVLPDGRVWNGLKGLRKDNTGYDMKHWFIGAEGTLGIITAATLKLYPKPAANVTAWVQVASAEDAVQLLRLAQQRMGAALTGFELITQICLDLVLKHFSRCRAPLPTPSPYAVLMESSDSESAEHAQNIFERVLEDAMEAGLAQDAVIASSVAQSQALWALRENISEAQAAEGKNIKHDISLPISAIPAFMHETAALLAQHFPGVRLVNFGHLGDGNLHYNISPPIGVDENAFLAQQSAINRVVHDQVSRYQGSISAEHGLGRLKREEIQRYRDPLDFELMQRMKSALDPAGIMNPGVLL